MISVIVPVYKVERYLRQCIDSIRNQTYRDLEIFLINDGSPDKCGEICDENAKTDKRIRVFHTENKGLSAARNLGLRKAKGEYIGFVDSDDWIEPDMYECLLRLLEGTGTDICNCGIRQECLDCRTDYNISDGICVGSDAIRALIYNRINSGVWNKLYKRSCWTGIRFPENHICEELATTYKVILKAHSVSCSSQHLYHYRMREGSIVHHVLMKLLMDFWIAVYKRSQYISALPEFKNDPEIIEALEKQVASATARTWKGVCGIPRNERDYPFLHMVSSFVREHNPMFFGKKGGMRSLVLFFFCRYTNDISFVTLSILKDVYHFFQKKTVSNKRLFPSG